MGTVVDLHAYRPARAAPDVPILPKPNFTRTPEMAFILALVSALPDKTRRKVLLDVMMHTDKHRDCAASREAGYLASIMSLMFEGRA